MATTCELIIIYGNANISLRPTPDIEGDTNAKIGNHENSPDLSFVWLSSCQDRRQIYLLMKATPLIRHNCNGTERLTIKTGTFTAQRLVHSTYS